MAPKLTGFAGNSRVRRILAAAALAGVELDYDSSFSMRSEWKTPQFLEKFPLGYLPAFEDGELRLQESGAIAEYVAELGPNQTIIPSDPKQKALVHQWMLFADQEIMIKHATAYLVFLNRLPYHKGVYSGVLDMIQSRLATLEKVLLDRTWLVGERLTLADVFVCTSLANAFSGHIDASMRAKVPNVVRYFETFVNQEKLAPIFDNGKPQLTDKPPTYQPPAKEDKPKADKPKAEKAPKPAAEAAPKKEKAPKKKEAEDDDNDEPLVPEEPKVKNPLDDLPKSAFNLEEWKRQYSNLDTRKEALPWFYEKFDREGFSVWRVDFKYNEELTQVFMSSNQIGGFFNRLEASRKYLFGSMGVLGKANDSIITGAVVCRGDSFKPVMEVAPDWESYSYKKIDLDNAEDKAYFEAAMAWDLTIDGRDWADGKNFK